MPVYGIDINISIHTGLHTYTNTHAAVENEMGRMVW